MSLPLDVSPSLLEGNKGTVPDAQMVNSIPTLLRIELVPSSFAGKAGQVIKQG